MASAEKIAMSLDDIIAADKAGNASNKSSRGRGRGRGRGSGRGRGGSGAGKSAPNRRPRVQAAYYEDDSYYGQQYAQPVVVQPRQQTTSIKTGLKLFISNLDDGVTSEDIDELYGKFGPLKRFGVNFDEDGKSRGTAEVMYSKREHALQAYSEYNNVLLDGKPMRIEYITSAEALKTQQPKPQPMIQLMPVTGRGRGGRGRGGEGRGRASRGRGGRGRGKAEREPKQKREPKTAEDLTTELDDYFNTTADGETAE